MRQKLVIEDETPDAQATRIIEEAEAAVIALGVEVARRAALGKKLMSVETKIALKELAESRKAMKREIKAQFDTEGHPEVRLVKGKSKIPVFQDLLKQAEICAKFPWVKPGSFVQDPEKSGGTLLAIICTCGAERSIHLCDTFHCQYCAACKKAKKSKK